MTTRYFALVNYIWAGGETASVSIWEVTEQAFKCLEPDHSAVKFDVDFASPAVQFNLRYDSEDDYDDDMLEGEEPIDFGDDPLIASFEFSPQFLLQAAPKTAGEVKCIHLTITPGVEDGRQRD